MRQSEGRSLAETNCTKGANPSGLGQFAIRTTIRNHTVLTRAAVIKQVADAVGSPHTVDLAKYDALILVEIYKVRRCYPIVSCDSCYHGTGYKAGVQANPRCFQNMCGMSVVGNDFEPLKRYNLAEIHEAARSST